MHCILIVPGRGGLYLILRGSVKKLDKMMKKNGQVLIVSSVVSGQVIFFSNLQYLFSEQLNPGECFGEADSPQESELTHRAKNVYPQYNSVESCMLLRINSADFCRVVEVSMSESVKATAAVTLHVFGSCPSCFMGEVDPC
jgi:hypothetical protein